MQASRAMANTYSDLIYHLIWSTKGRAPCIGVEIEERIWAIIAKIGSQSGISIRRVGGTMRLSPFQPHKQ